jgi:O-antigen/teichoic acid export membrane protein
VIGQSFWFGSLLLLAGLLSPSAFGTVTIGLLMVTAAIRLMGTGIHGSIIVAPRVSRSQVMTAVRSTVASGIALSAGIVLLSGPIAHSFVKGGDALVIATLGLGPALYAPQIVPAALLEKQFQFKRRASVLAASTITASTASVVAALLGAGVWSLVIRQLLLQTLLSILGWLAVRRLLPPRNPDPAQPHRQRLPRRGAIGFLLFSITDFVVFNADYLTVGHLTNTVQLGLYSMAFTIAFAPVSQFAAQLGGVLFTAAAASDADTMRRRTIAGVRLTSLLLLPLLPVAFVLAPVAIPGILGERWRGMVAPFQILVIVGVAHAIVNVVGESLAGAGHIGFRARINAVWMAGMIPALVVLVQADGIRGAALAHLTLYLPVALAYGVWGMRILGAEPRELGRALLPVSGPIGLQTAVTIGVFLAGSSLPPAIRAILAAGLGVVAGASLMVAKGQSVLSEAGRFFTAARERDE